ncbi:MAG: hypothetical protein ABJN43_20675, partial [Sneathiella sp.]
VVGIFADALNAVVYTGEAGYHAVTGDFGRAGSAIGNAGISVAAMVPGAGHGATAAKWAARGAGKAGSSSAGKITGYTKHGLNQAIGRDGGKGVKAQEMLNAVRDPKKVVEQANGTVKYQGKKATVILNNDGKVVTTYGKSRGPQIWK